MMTQNTKRGFTLVELLVVITIIAILAAVSIPLTGKLLATGRDTACKNNLYNLGQATSAYLSEHNASLPSSGGYAYNVTFTERERDSSGSTQKIKVVPGCSHVRGWVYWNHNCVRKNDLSKSCTCFDTKTRPLGGLSPTPAPWYAKPETSKKGFDDALLCIQNGSLFNYVKKSMDVYRCKTFAQEAKTRFPNYVEDVAGVRRSYAMNYLAAADKRVYTSVRKASPGDGKGVPLSSLSGVQARTALFVELDIDNTSLSSSAEAGDQVWNWDPDAENPENIGFCHKIDNNWVAHVCFADGHVEVINDPSENPNSISREKRKQLSVWLGSGGSHKDGINYGK